MNRAQRGKLALTAAAIGVSLLTAGCGYITPQQTSHQYSASDGIRADLGPLQLRNFLIVSGGEDEPGRLIGAVYNSSSKDVKLTVNGAKGSSRQCQFAALGPVHRSGTHVTYSSRNLKSFSAIAYPQRGANEDSAVSHPPRERSPHALICASVKRVKGLIGPFSRVFSRLGALSPAGHMPES